jgi:hypothetical protein
MSAVSQQRPCHLSCAVLVATGITRPLWRHQNLAIHYNANGSYGPEADLARKGGKQTFENGVGIFTGHIKQAFQNSI